jgi:hypothetical protein
MMMQHLNREMHVECHKDRVDGKMMPHLNRELHVNQWSSRMLKAQGLQVRKSLLVVALALHYHEHGHEKQTSRHHEYCEDCDDEQILPYFQPYHNAKQASPRFLKVEAVQVGEFVLVVELALTLHWKDTIQNLRASCLQVQAVHVVGVEAYGDLLVLAQLEPPCYVHNAASFHERNHEDKALEDIA